MEGGWRYRGPLETSWGALELGDMSRMSGSRGPGFPVQTGGGSLPHIPGPSPKGLERQGRSGLQLLPAVWGPAVVCWPQPPRPAWPPGLPCAPAAGL